ncbi:hypothetical protein K435DRAFT_673232 [Dendrothele bispora CBS 962.96]|uniref:Copper radical oxidase n=1 Tax=Dendrothele bispora (strain CBS 962.96) TaxID=1314807 RepID=A0A4S8LRG5_DENBC|nr:hypothetical protein K435DRAFT_673232 [Dendrothele bispora CBS 962.96]
MSISLLTFFSLGTLALAVGIATDPSPSFSLLQDRAFVSGDWELTQPGETGVSAMQLAIMSESTVIILDRKEDNWLENNSGQPAWASELNLNTNQVRALNPTTDTFCATGSFLGNGTFVSSGGNSQQTINLLLTAPQGFQGIRLFTPCTDNTCDIFENPAQLHLTSNRWYPSSVRLDDGSVMIYGGSTDGGKFQNRPDINNPTYEFFPPKNINGFNGVQIPSQFLCDTMNGNNFPIMMMLPNGNIFIAANQQAMLFNWRNNTKIADLPKIPNDVRVTSPYSAGAVLLPLTPENNYTPEVMICGGSNVSDAIDFESKISSQTPASAQCARMVLTPQGITANWSVENMPQSRVMPELILLPDGRVLIVNGAQTGVAGYSNVADQIGLSNADHPALTPVIYDPSAAPGRRFSSEGIPASTIPRMYHSTSSLTPNGSVLLAGSNPNNNFNSSEKYPTEYRFEFYSPPYMFQPRPTYTGLPATVDYNSRFELSVDLPFNLLDIPSVANIILTSDYSFATHGVHMDQRYLKLRSILSLDRRTLTVTGPPSATHYPPGPAYLYVVTSAGVPSFGHRTLVGTGASPPVDEDAISK